MMQRLHTAIAVLALSCLLAACGGEKAPELPALDVIAEQFSYKGKMLGRLELAAVPVEPNWRVDRLRLTNADGAFSAEGLVQDVKSQPRTRTTVHLEVSDVGKFLDRLGFPDGVRRGTARLDGTLAWPGAPQDFDYATLTGNLRLDASRGQFVKLEPGIGKLLGILSLQALPRRVTLDFRDVFSEGFAFDQIQGDVSIERGIASTGNFRIQGPAARVAMSGEVDLVRETQKLQVRVAPSLSDSVAIAGALLGGPVAGVATILAQKILKDPLDQIFAYEYSVTGTWAEPQVSKIDRAGPATSDGAAMSSAESSSSARSRRSTRTSRSSCTATTRCRWPAKCGRARWRAASASRKRWTNGSTRTGSACSCAAAPISPGSRRTTARSCAMSRR